MFTACPRSARQTSSRDAQERSQVQSTVDQSKILRSLVFLVARVGFEATTFGLWGVRAELVWLGVLADHDDSVRLIIVNVADLAYPVPPLAPSLALASTTDAALPVPRTSPPMCDRKYEDILRDEHEDDAIGKALHLRRAHVRWT